MGPHSSTAKEVTSWSDAIGAVRSLANVQSNRNRQGVLPDVLHLAKKIAQVMRRRCARCGLKHFPRGAWRFGLERAFVLLAT